MSTSRLTLCVLAIGTFTACHQTSVGASIDGGGENTALPGVARPPQTSVPLAITAPSGTGAPLDIAMPSGTSEPSAGTLHFTIDPAGVASCRAEGMTSPRAFGTSSNFRGSVDVDPQELGRLRGTIEIDLTDARASFYPDATRNAALTDTARDWLGLGVDVEFASREKNRWARFTVKEVESAKPSRLSEAVEQGGGRFVHLRLRGEMRILGVSSDQTVDLDTSWEGPLTAPALVRWSNMSPIRISRREHGIAARDSSGRPLPTASHTSAREIPDRWSLSIDRLLLKRASR